MELIDSHCHLQFESLANDLPAILERANEMSVTRMICVGTTLQDSQTAIDLAAQHANIWATVGTHPHEAKDFLRDVQARDKLSALIGSPKVIAIGEIGLDYYKNYAPREEQQGALRLQIEAGLPTGRPFVFHVRDAWDDFWPIFDAYPGLRGVVHSFTATTEQLEQSLTRGLYVSLNGIMTFTKDEKQLEAAKQVPLERLLLETDAPFLTPAPDRGQTCEPRHVRRVAEFLAELRGEDLRQLAVATTANAVRLFGLEGQQ